MFYQLKFILFVTLASFFCLFAPLESRAAAKDAASMLTDADSCRKSLYESSNKMKFRHNWEKCIGGYERLITEYPESDQAAWALYQAARMYRDMFQVSQKNSDMDQALKLFRLLPQHHENHRLADDGLYWAGEILRTYKNAPEEAYRSYLKILHDHPSGDMAPKARTRIQEMGGKIVEPQAAESREGARLLERADLCLDGLLKSTEKKKFRHNWRKCIEIYEKIVESFPETDQGVRALYALGGLYAEMYGVSRRAEDLDEAIRRYRQVVERYRSHPVAEQAQFEIAMLVHLHRNSPTQAYVEFLKVEIMFPSGAKCTEAREMLDRLAVNLAKADTGPATPAGVGGDESGTASVKGIRHWSTPNYTRVVVDLDNPVRYRHNLLEADAAHKKPARIYIDLDRAVVSKDIESAVPIKDGLLQRARAGQYQPETVRVVLDSELVGEYKVFHLHDPFRIVVDVRRSAKAEVPGKPPSRPARKGVRKADAPDQGVSLARQLGLSVRRVVIDPGHGGKDPGCNLPGGVFEKDIVLDVGKILAERIRTRFGWEVFLTRECDEFLPLERRTAIANMHKADLFISLHINAHKNSSVHGIETYFLNMATDENAVMVAARENATSEKNLSDLQTILNELMMNTKIEESSRLAHSVHKGLVGHVGSKYKNVKNLGVKQAPFYVLIGAEMPAVLLELGFLTNGTEKKRLMDKGYRRILAEGISAGLKNYLDDIEQLLGAWKPAGSPS
ncbi:MAG TPA: N-acetylmuramoyl-L-alanine amidase [Desulfobacteraceae bacterium]|nr:N-acetylmuramoyl-L-alanine amidase [Desulfobacteraceae bacterium]